MIFEAQGTFPNYYEVLGVSENASSSDIQAALDRYRASFEAQLNNYLTMGPARKAMNEIVPAIQQNLLYGDKARAEYDQKLAASRRKQTGQFEPADDEGLDEGLRIPFLFKPFEDFDT